MRIIKFRIWDGETFINLSTTDILKKIDKSNTSRELEQYTGLKDKKGKEIYENDIVKCTQLGQIKNGLVVFTRGLWNWQFENGKICWLDEAVKNWDGCVIGNIHENPELLT